MTSSAWRTWAQRKDWATLQSELMTIITAAHGWHALAQIEIRADTSAGPNFECSNIVIPDPTAYSPDFSEPCRQYYP
jgi:hypothetical protein